MKKILLIIILNLFVFNISNSNEMNLKTIGESNRASYFIDANSVTYDGEYIQFALITLLKKQGKLQDGRKWFSAKTIIQGDCNGKRVKDIVAEFYDKKVNDGNFAKANLLKKDEIKEERRIWYEAEAPGKINTLILDSACMINFRNTGKKIIDSMKKN